MKLLSLLVIGLAFSAWAQSDLIKILDSDGKAIEGAEVMIGWAVDDPFANNFLTTDKNGEVEVPAEWITNNTKLPVTINVDGFIRRTYFGQFPEAASFSMQQKELKKRIQLKGKTTKFTNMKDFDGLVDFGLVIPGLRRTDMMTFDVGRVISPEVDTISIVGQQIDLPSNLTLPKQRERYWVSITFDKPVYRTFFSESGATKAFALHGRFPLQKVAGKLRNGTPFIEVLNDVEFVSGSHHDLNLTSSGQKNKRLSVANIKFKKGARATAPRLRSNEIMIAATLSDVDGYLFPSDIKTVESGKTVSLKTARTKHEKYLLRTVQPKSVLTNKRTGDDRPLSATLDKLSNRSTLNFIKYVDQPKIIGDDFVLDKPKKSSQVTSPLGTIVTLSDIEKKKNGNFTIEIKRRSWELFTRDWHSSLQVPVWPGSFTPMASQRRLEVMYLGGSSTSNINAGPDMINHSTHVVYNKRDI